MLNLKHKILTKLILLILAQMTLFISLVYPESSSSKNISSLYIQAKGLRVPLDSSNEYNRMREVLNEQQANVILSSLSIDDEQLRDPNKLCSWIAYFGTSSEMFDPYKVLEVILDKIDQSQYADAYKEALKIKISIVEENRRRGLVIPPYEYQKEDWEVINTEGLEGLISSLRPFDKPQAIEPSGVELGSLGHGVDHTTNEGELDDFREAVKIVNGYVKEGRIMGSEKITSPFIAHGAEIQAGESKEISWREHKFRIEVFGDKIIIESLEKDTTPVAFYAAVGTLIKDWEPRGMDIAIGPSGILKIDGREYSFYTKDRSLILKPLHEIMLIHRSVARHLMVTPFGQERKARAGEYRIPNDGFRDLLYYSSPDEIPELMDRYFEWLKTEEIKIGTGALHPVELAAQAFCRLMWIHPFENGNTRTASLVMNYILMKNNYPPTVLTESNQGDFFKVLRFMHVPSKSGVLNGKFIPVIDSAKIFSFVPKDFTAFLAPQIKQMSTTETRLEATIDDTDALEQVNLIRTSL